MRHLIVGLSAALLFASSAAAQSAPKPAWGTFGVDFESMDRSVHPGDDHWSYVNGTWARTTPVPPDRGALSQVQRLNDLAASQVKAILDERISRRATLKGDDLRAADYYAALMDQAAIDRRGPAPLLADLAPIRAARDHSALAAQMGRLVPEWMPTPALGRMPRYFPSPFSARVGQDSKEPTRYTVGIGQAGLGIPNRDYYLRSDEASARTQAAYRKHAATMLTLTGVPAAEADRRAAAVYEFERKIAEAHWTLAE